MTITFRIATAQDIDFCFTLTKENMKESFEKYWGGFSDTACRKHISIDSTRLIYLDGKLVGYFALTLCDAYWCLDNIQLRSEFCGHGIGTGVLSHVFSIVRESDCSRVHLTVFKDNAALKLYERNGFVVLSEKNNALLMEKVF